MKSDRSHKTREKTTLAKNWRGKTHCGQKLGADRRDNKPVRARSKKPRGTIQKTKRRKDLFAQRGSKTEKKVRKNHQRKERERTGSYGEKVVGRRKLFHSIWGFPKGDERHGKSNRRTLQFGDHSEVHIGNKSSDQWDGTKQHILKKVLEKTKHQP